MKNMNIDTKQTLNTEALAFEAEVTEFIKGLSGDSDEWTLITQQHDFPFEVASHDTREMLTGDLADALTCHYATVAILHRQRRLTCDEVQALELEAMEILGRISRARAKGRL